MRRIAFAFIGAALSGCVTTQPCTGVPSFDGSVCAVSRDPVVAQHDIQSLADQTARERAALVAYLGNDVGLITVIVRKKGNARHKPPATIFIPSRLIPKRHAITAHEITHLLTQGWASQILKEGLAVYAQYRFGEQQGWPNYRRSVHDAARRWRNDPRIAVDTPGAAESALRKARKGETARRLAAYSVAGSWVAWILEVKMGGDIARFLGRLYRTGDYEATLGANYGRLLTEWRAYLDAR